MGAVFYLGAGWPQRKPLGFQGTHLPLKRGSGLKVVFIQKKWLIRVCSHFQFDLHENPFSSGNSCKHDVPTCCPILRNSHLVSAKHSIVWSSTYRRRVCKMETLVLFSKSKFWPLTCSGVPIIVYNRSLIENVKRWNNQLWKTFDQLSRENILKILLTIKNVKTLVSFFKWT